jgi:sec-independent protein translocase protein TatC
MWIKKKRDSKKPSEKMHITEHLEELRYRLIVCIISIVVCSIGGYFITPEIIGLLTKPVGELIFLKPTEALMVRIKLALFTGCILSAPVILYQIWEFVKPGLYPHEKRSVIPITIFSCFFLY